MKWSQANAEVSAQQKAEQTSHSKTVLVTAPPPSESHILPILPPGLPILRNQDLNKFIFVRADPLDDYHYLIEPPGRVVYGSDAKGASIAIQTTVANQTAVVTGSSACSQSARLCGFNPQYRHDPYVFGFGVAPFVAGNGTYNDPLKKTSTSSLQTGADFVAGVLLPTPNASFPFQQFLPLVHYFYISPYHQTDFRNVANINGVTAAWEPENLYLMLGASAIGNPYFHFYWQYRGEFDWSDVTTIGSTNLTRQS